jgi:hypothetical protein
MKIIRDSRKTEATLPGDANDMWFMVDDDEAADLGALREGGLVLAAIKESRLSSFNEDVDGFGRISLLLSLESNMVTISVSTSDNIGLARRDFSTRYFGHARILAESLIGKIITPEILKSKKFILIE